MVHISLVETLQVNELHGKWKNKGCRSWRELEALSWVSSSCHQTFIPDGQRSGFFIGGGCALLVCLRHLEVAKRKKEYCGKELQSEHLELEDTVTPILRFLPLSLKKSVQWLSGLRVWCCDCCGSGYSCGAGLIPGQKVKKKKSVQNVLISLCCLVYSLRQWADVASMEEKEEKRGFKGLTGSWFLL